MKKVYFTGCNRKEKAIINSIEPSPSILMDIEKVINTHYTYIGGYRGLDNTTILEPILCYDQSFIGSTFEGIISNEESIYSCIITTKIKIGSLSEKKYLIATLYDLMLSLIEPLQGFTVQSDALGDYYLLICSNGEYILNPNYNKENQDATK